MNRYSHLYIKLRFYWSWLSNNRKNAPYLLSGYNTMGKEKQEQVDLKGLLYFSKRFNINLGVLQAIISFFLYYLGCDEELNLFLSTYSIEA